MASTRTLLHLFRFVDFHLILLFSGTSFVIHLGEYIEAGGTRSPKARGVVSLFVFSLLLHHLEHA